MQVNDKVVLIGAAAAEFPDAGVGVIVPSDVAATHVEVKFDSYAEPMLLNRRLVERA